VYFWVHRCDGGDVNEVNEGWSVDPEAEDGKSSQAMELKLMAATRKMLQQVAMKTLVSTMKTMAFLHLMGKLRHKVLNQMITKVIPMHKYVSILHLAGLTIQHDSPTCPADAVATNNSTTATNHTPIKQLTMVGKLLWQVNMNQSNYRTVKS
jgi:hypothetical protein